MSNLAVLNSNNHIKQLRPDLKVLRFGSNEQKTPVQELTAFVVKETGDQVKELGLKLQLSQNNRKILLSQDLTVDQAKSILAARIGNLSETLIGLANTDALTGLNNNNAYERIYRLKTAREACKNQEPLGIINLDLNKFKDINDTFGHAEGDKALKVSAQVFKDIIKAPGKIFRKGGDEFLILVPNSNFENTGKIAEEVRKNVETKTKELKQNNELQSSFTASVGYAVFDPQKIENSQEFSDLEKIMGKYQNAYGRSDDASYSSKGYAHRGTGQRAVGLEE